MKIPARKAPQIESHDGDDGTFKSDGSSVDQLRRPDKGKNFFRSLAPAKQQQEERKKFIRFPLSRLSRCREPQMDGKSDF
jgi:hypothetical protein